MNRLTVTHEQENKKTNKKSIYTLGVTWRTVFPEERLQRFSNLFHCYQQRIETESIFCFQNTKIPNKNKENIF